jgi:hypothetical protein
MPHKYDEIVRLFTAAFAEMRRIGLGEVLAKGGVGEILLAQRLGHELVATDKGADGVDGLARRFEYKVSVTNQFNFHFGTRELRDPPAEKVKRHFRGVEGAYCALREGERFLRIVFCPVDTLVEYLCSHFALTKGSQLNKNFRLEAFAKLKGAVEVTADIA